MQGLGAVARLAALLSPASALLSASVATGRGGLTPVTRVVELLNGLATKIEEDAKQEEDLFETYQCWAKSVISQKEAANAKAESRRDSLNTFITDLDAGRIDLTSERTDLQKELAGLASDIEQATALRNQENKDFLAAKEEMEDSVDALTRALAVLRQGMGKAFLSLKVHAFLNTYAAQKEESDLLDKAVAIGSKVLNSGDAMFLARVLDAEPPTKDWKKLNRKATFKQNYTARSEKIESLLQKLLEDLSSDLEEATAKEAAAKTLFDKLMTTKGGQKTTAEASLSGLGKEGGARALSKSDAEAEREALAQQITDDEGFITSTKTSMDTKKTEWGDRQKIRQGELAAISEAVSVLRSDDARDLLKKSYGSQGYLFLQEASAVRGARARGATELLRQIMRKTGDRRLAGLSFLASKSKTHFDAVIGHIDTLLGELNTENGEELTKKETCETDRAEDTRAAVVTSREIDELSDDITAAQAKIEEIEKEVVEKEEEIAKINVTLVEMKENRDKETEEYTKAKKDDEDAVELVGNAKTVLETFYASIALVQGRATAGQPVETVAGEAPPPPPATWDAPYKGKKEESTGIVALLGIIKADIEADITAATTAEGAAQTAYDTEKGNLDSAKGALDTEISTLDGQKSGHESDITTDEGDRSNKKDDLKVKLQKIKDAQPFCDWLLINFDARTANRQAEIDGLEKAKAILNGADFSLVQRPRVAGLVARAA